MGPVEAVKSVLIKKYVNLSGRASRSEFWWYLLAYCLFVVISYIFTDIFILIFYEIFWDFHAGTQINPYFWVDVLKRVGLALLSLPLLAVIVRRLHDRNVSGWWILCFPAAFVIGHIAIFCLFFRVWPFSEGFLESFIYSTILFFPFPVALYIFMLVWAAVILARAGELGPNRFGPDPLEAATSSDVSLAASEG